MARALTILVVIAAFAGDAAAEDERLTGVSADVTRYRVGKKTVCDLAEPPACVAMSAKRQKKLKLKAPKKKPRLTATLADGRTLEVRIAGSSACGSGVTTRDDPTPGCDDVALMALLAPTLEIVVRDTAGHEVRLVSDSRDQLVRDSPPADMPGTIFHVVWSKDATRVVVAYQSSEMVVVGWDLGSRLAAE